jgi:transcriptional regulator with XRE-family HTH domain
MIRKRRLDLGLRQIDAANMMGCDEMSVVNWEKGHHSPRVNHMAGVVEFLGFNPFQNGDTMAHRLINYRKPLGMTQKEFAGEIGVDPSTLARWERGERKPTGRFRQHIDFSIGAALQDSKCHSRLRPCVVKIGRSAG